MVKALVSMGRLVVDEAVDLPDGTVVELAPHDPGDRLDDRDRERLHRALAASEDDIEAGRLHEADDVLAELRAT